MNITSNTPTFSNASHHESAPNHGYCDITSKVAAAVANFFRTVVLWFVETGSWTKDRLIDLLPRQIAMRLDPRRIFVHAILDVAANQRADVLKHSLPLISPPIEQNKLEQLIQLVNNENSNSSLLSHLPRFVTRDMYSPDSIRSIHVIAAIPDQNRAHIMESAHQVFTERMKASDKLNIIDDRAVRELASQVFTQPLSQYETRIIITDIKAIPFRERAFIMKLARQAFSQQTQKDPEKLIKAIIEAITDIPAQERDSVIELAQLAFTEQMNRDEKIGIINAIVAIPAQERASVMEFALQAFTDRMQRYDKRNIIRAITNIPAHGRASVMVLALQAFTDRMDADKRSNIIRAITNIPAHERASVMEFALQAFTEQIQGYDKSDIIEAITAIPAQERASVIRHALLLINDRMYDYDRIMIIQQVAAIRMDERANYVQQRLGRGRIVYQDARVAAEQGINVHVGDRDQRVKKAIELLRKIQGTISKDKVEKAVKDFTTYLDESKMDAKHKKLARHALSGAKQPRENFGPLIDKENFSIFGLLISGEELIARLWIFASELKEPEQKNAKYGMISALKDSYNDPSDGRSRVCNQGKTQRLMIAVLQGRLAGVNIELQEEMKPGTSEAIRAFFSVEAHRNIDQLRPLLAAAEQYCRESPLIAHDDFIREIKKYAQLMGFE